MRPLTTAARRASLLVVLVTLAVAGLSAQSSSESRPASAGSAGTPQTGGSTQAPTVQGQPERERQSDRRPRTSRRQPVPSLRESLQRHRTSRNEPKRQELTLTVNMLGGHDDNLAAGRGTAPGHLPGDTLSGSTGFLDTTLDYFRGNTARSLRVTSTGNLRTFPGFVDRPAAGAILNLEARAEAGEKVTIGASERAGYEPMFSVFAPSGSAAPLLPTIGELAPATGLFERRAFRSESAVFLEHLFTVRDSTSVSYAYQKQQFFDNAGDSNSHNVSAGYRKRITPRLNVSMDYRYVHGEYFDNSLAARPRREHRLEVGPELSRAFSRRRRLSVSIAAGATRFESAGSVAGETFVFWAPTGAGRVTLRLSPQSSIEAGYTRRFTLLQGLTDEAYRTDSAYVTTGGLVTDRTFLSVGATYSNGQTPTASGIDSKFDIYGLSTQMRFGITRTTAATVGYDYYHHKFSHPRELSFGVPAEFGRQAFRVGLTLSVPLVGRPATTLLTSR